MINKIQSQQQVQQKQQEIQCQCVDFKCISTYLQECLNCGKISNIEDTCSLEDRKLTGYMRSSLSPNDKKLQQFLSWEMYKTRILDLIQINKQILIDAKRPEIPTEIIQKSLEELKLIWSQVKMKGKTPDRVLVSIIINECTSNQYPVNTRQMIKLLGIEDEKIQQGVRFIREHKIFQEIIQEKQQENKTFDPNQNNTDFIRALNNFNTSFQVISSEEQKVLKIHQLIKTQQLFPELIQITKCIVVASILIYQRFIDRQCDSNHKKSKRMSFLCKKCLIIELKAINSDVRKLKKYSQQLFSHNIPDFNNLNLLIFN